MTLCRKDVPIQRIQTVVRSRKLRAVYQSQWCKRADELCGVVGVWLATRNIPLFRLVTLAVFRVSARVVRVRREQAEEREAAVSVPVTHKIWASTFV